MFIAMDPPKHDEQRKAVSPIVAPGQPGEDGGADPRAHLPVLDGLPRNETFDWVDKVSIELTTLMLATLFDFPFEDRRKLTYWSDVATMVDTGGARSRGTRHGRAGQVLAYFTRLWNERVNAPPRNDLVSMLAHGPATRNMSRRSTWATWCC
jgi:cytochrome P450